MKKFLWMILVLLVICTACSAQNEHDGSEAEGPKLEDQTMTEKPPFTEPTDTKPMETKPTEPTAPSQPTEPSDPPPTQPDKVYCTVTLEADFADNLIMICVYPQWNDKEYTLADFAEIGCIEIRQIFNPRQNESPSRILALTLDKHSKQNVLDCIRILEQREDIYSAGPDMAMTID